MKAKIIFFVTSMLLFQSCISGTHTSKHAQKKHLNNILNKTLEYTNKELKDINKYKHKNKSKKYISLGQLEDITEQLKQKRIKILRAQENNTLDRLKNTVKKERLLVSLDKKEFDLPENISFGYAPNYLIFENNNVPQDKLTKKRARFFKFKHCLWGSENKDEYVDSRYATAGQFVADTLVYMDTEKNETPRDAYKKMYPFIQMPENIRGFFKKYAYDKSLSKFYMGKLYKKYTKASVKKIQSDAIAGKALKYQVDILLKPHYVRPFTHDLLALIKKNKYLKEHVDYVKVNTNITITELTKREIAPNIVIYPCLLPANKRETVLKKIIEIVHHKFRNYSEEITYNFAPTCSLKVKDFIALSGGNYFEKSSYKNIVTAGRCKNSIYTPDYIFFKNNSIDISQIREALC